MTVGVGGQHVDPGERRETYNGASDALARAVEITVTPIIFGFLGSRLDLWLGTRPAFTVALATFCLGYLSWKLCVAYSAEMQAHEARLLGAGDRRVQKKRAA
ncbi:MAG TPA: AtpZ/AtpI family protein [Acidimicrobiales bacterium]|nr:AtpZ/AtpI family protein [Acidimicrobiales bacterium]